MKNDNKQITERIIRFLANLDIYIASLILLILIIITFMGVFYRYIVGAPLTWLEEVQLVCLVWIGFMASGAAFRSGSHIAIEMLVELLPVCIQKVIAWFVRMVVMVVLIYLTIQCTGYFRLFLYNQRLTPVLRVPYAFIYAIPAISCIVMIVSYIWYEFHEMTRKDMEEDKIYE